MTKSCPLLISCPFQHATYPVVSCLRAIPRRCFYCVLTQNVQPTTEQYKVLFTTVLSWWTVASQDICRRVSFKQKLQHWLQISPYRARIVPQRIWKSWQWDSSFTIVRNSVVHCRLVAWRTKVKGLNFAGKLATIVLCEINMHHYLIMVALCNRADHYIFILFLLLSYFFFFLFFLA